MGLEDLGDSVVNMSSQFDLKLAFGLAGLFLDFSKNS